MNYRKYYEEYFNIKIPKGYEIHHIDGNRENNNIYNLILIPKELHQEYHKCLTQFNHYVANGIHTKVDEYPLLSVQYVYLDKLVNVMKQIDWWVLYKNHLGYPKDWENVSI